MALVDYENDLIAKIEVNEILIPQYKKDIERLTSEVARAEDSITKERLVKELASTKSNLENCEKDIKYYKNAKRDVSQRSISIYEKAKKAQTIANIEIDKLKGEIAKSKVTLQKDELSSDIRQGATKLLLAQEAELKIKENNLVHINDNLRRAYTKIQVAANLREGWTSFIKTAGFIWEDYIESMKSASIKAEGSKLEYFKIIAKETFKMIGTFAETAFKTFFKTSEEVFKNTVKSWGTSIREAISPIFKPFMFVIGGLQLAIKGLFKVANFFTGKKNPEKEDFTSEEEKNPIMKHTRVLPDILTAIDDLLLTFRMSLDLDRLSYEDKKRLEELQLAYAERKEKADARNKQLQPDKNAPSDLWKNAIGIGAFAVAYINTRVKTLVMIFKMLAAPFKLLGSILTYISGPAGTITRGVLIVAKIFGTIGKVFGFIGGLFAPIAKFFGVAIRLARFTTPLLKFIPIIGQIVAIGIALWDFIEGWNETEGNWFDKFLGGIWAVIEGILDWPAALLDMVLDMFNMKPEGGVLKMLKDYFFWLFGFGWLKNLIKLLPSWIVPDKVMAWAHGTKDTKAQGALPEAIADKNDAAKADKKKQEQKAQDAQDALVDLAGSVAADKGSTAIASSSSSGGSSTGSGSPPMDERKIKDRVSPELAWAAFAAMR